MIGSCPNYNSPDWKNLERHFINTGMSQHDAAIEATRVFISHDYLVPHVETLSQIKSALKFQSSGISDLKKAMMLKALKKYNYDNNVSHRIDFKQSSPTSYAASLHLNFMSKKLVELTKPNQLGEVGSYSGAVIETILDSEDNNQAGEFVVDGEVYPTY